jgi:hypothetical protein
MFSLLLSTVATLLPRAVLLLRLRLVRFRILKLSLTAEGMENQGLVSKAFKKWEMYGVLSPNRPTLFGVLH